MSDFIPGMIRFDGQPCLVVGGGKVAARKIRKLVACKAEITVISPELHPDTAELQHNFHFLKRAFKQGDTKGAFFVVAASDNSQINLDIYNEAKHHVPLYNIADNQKHSNFFFPAVMERGPLKISVSTSGASPIVSKKIIVQLQQLFSADYEPFLETIGGLRQQILEANVPAEIKKVLLNTLADDKLLNAYKKKDEKMIESIISEVEEQVTLK
ncbi:precorrin-2 dehydrogenase/sirohydrochlorin ferrochelatase family protein [Salipaludibacillus aurantiacus]|uniref:precorrin-2 dehydrogenase n=1 Tax=Salipaludibacillus aurantiacus TaxID=1601833 RepID=A0A1H9WZ63_9BACI|nr:bifunctional precorrin-2 dehydrogenase/sirohydrochlorin ferrochelatase [Salipaludibacillus aurantiacus]SES38947.1 precorrin-2 dehydrogenase / sirohydrochlorin ferrochelatase [Salipaludibacillus aurantiacus]